MDKYLWQAELKFERSVEYQLLKRAPSLSTRRLCSAVVACKKPAASGALGKRKSKQKVFGKNGCLVRDMCALVEEGQREPRERRKGTCKNCIVKNTREILYVYT